MIIPTDSTLTNANYIAIDLFTRLQDLPHTHVYTITFMRLGMLFGVIRAVMRKIPAPDHDAFNAGLRAYVIPGSVVSLFLLGGV